MYKTIFSTIAIHFKKTMIMQFTEVCINSKVLAKKEL